MCALFVIFVETSQASKRSSRLVQAQLERNDLDPAVRLLILMDYVEQMVRLVLGPQQDSALLSPCAFINFVQTCYLGDN
jgi:hypothetical protein